MQRRQILTSSRLQFDAAKGSDPKKGEIADGADWSTVPTFPPSSSPEAFPQCGDGRQSKGTAHGEIRAAFPGKEGFFFRVVPQSSVSHNADLCRAVGRHKQSETQKLHQMGAASTAEGRSPQHCRHCEVSLLQTLRFYPWAHHTLQTFAAGSRDSGRGREVPVQNVTLVKSRTVSPKLELSFFGTPRPRLGLGRSAPVTNKRSKISRLRPAQTGLAASRPQLRRCRSSEERKPGAG